MTKEKYKAVINPEKTTAEIIIYALFGSVENFIMDLKKEATEKKL